MSVARKVRSVERLFDRLEKEIKALQEETGIHCLSGCGRCCTKPDIEASPLEFLPLAFEYFKQGTAYQLLEKLEAESSPICISYAPLSLTQHGNGRCGNYLHRGLICRLFGFAASRDKYEQLRLVTCREIKESQPSSVEAINVKIQNREPIPIFTNYYRQLTAIDFRLANQLLPINQAIRMAVEEVLHYYAYRPYRPVRKSA